MTWHTQQTFSYIFLFFFLIFLLLICELYFWFLLSSLKYHFHWMNFELFWDSHLRIVSHSHSTLIIHFPAKMNQISTSSNSHFCTNFIARCLAHESSLEKNWNFQPERMNARDLIGWMFNMRLICFEMYIFSLYSSLVFVTVLRSAQVKKWFSLMSELQSTELDWARFLHTSLLDKAQHVFSTNLFCLCDFSQHFRHPSSSECLCLRTTKNRKTLKTAVASEDAKVLLSRRFVLFIIIEKRWYDIPLAQLMLILKIILKRI